MKIICSRNELLYGVNNVLKAVSSKTTMPILECILLDANINEFKLISNDLQLGIESKISAMIIEPGQIALDAKIFSEIIRKLPESQVEISVDQNNLTTIKCEKSKFNISGQSGDEFVQLPKIEKKIHIQIAQNILKEMIRQTIFSIAVDELRPILTGEFFEIKNSILSIVSVDGNRVSIRKSNIEEIYDDIKVVIPGKTLNEISKIFNSDNTEKIDIYFSDKHVLIEFENNIIVSRLLEGDYIKYEQIFSRDFETKLILSRKELLMSIERAALITKDVSKIPIKFTIKDDSLIITSNTELGNSYEELSINKEGKNLNIAFNPRFLTDALKVIDDEKIEILFTNSLSPCIIQQTNGNDYKYLILPVKIND